VNAVRAQVQDGDERFAPGARTGHRVVSRRPIKLAVGVAAAALMAFPGAARAATYSPLDESSLQTSIQGDRFEIAGGKIAQSQGVTPGVRALGARLVADHTKSLHEAAALAHKLGIEVPGSPTPSEEWELTTIAGMSGTAFDAAYAHLEVQDHKQDIEETAMEFQKGLNHSVRHLAHSDLPMLRTHLRLSKQALWAIPGTWPPEG
jgi:putative membrane protein